MSAPMEMGTREWVAQGLREGVKGNRLVALQPLDANGALEGRPSHFSAQGSGYDAGLTIGGVYAFATVREGERTRVTFPKVPRRVRMWSDRAAIEAWAVEAKAVQAEFDQRALDKRLKAETEALTVSLAPIRKAYVQASPAGRVGIELLVLRALRGYIR